MTTLSTPGSVADALVRARREHRPASAAALAGMPTSAEEAYAVQMEVARQLGWFGAEPPRHWKSGGPSRDAVLTHAPLPPAGVWHSPARSGPWPFHLRGIEAEVALRLGRDVDTAQAAALDAAGAAALIDAMAVSIELVDSRWQEALEAPPLAKLADLQSHGALVLGDWVPYAARDWQAQACRVQVGTQPPVVRRGSHSLNDPAFLLPAWLRHATRHGGRVGAGTVVTTGTWVGILHAAAGDLVTAEFPGIGHASVQL